MGAEPAQEFAMSFHRLATAILLAVLLLLSHPVLAAVPRIECTSSDSQNADASTGTLRDWSAVHVWFLRWARCDDGGTGEGVSEAISLLLADHWNTTARLAFLGRHDPAFANFVILHIDETVPNDRWKRVARSARVACPVGARVLCNRIVRATQPLVPR